MNAYICPSAMNDFGLLIFESLDDDNWDRSLQPIYVAEEGTEESNVLNAFMDTVWDGFYTGQVRQSRFPAIVDSADTIYTITLTGSPPKD